MNQDLKMGLQLLIIPKKRRADVWQLNLMDLGSNSGDGTGYITSGNFRLPQFDLMIQRLYYVGHATTTLARLTILLAFPGPNYDI